MEGNHKFNERQMFQATYAPYIVVCISMLAGTANPLQTRVASDCLVDNYFVYGKRIKHYVWSQTKAHLARCNMPVELFVVPLVINSSWPDVAYMRPEKQLSFP